MAVWVSLLRGINLGARNKVPMPVLRDALAKAGFSNVRTYVQSGNVITSSRHRSPNRVAAVVREVVSEQFGLDLPVVVRSPAQLRAVHEWNPFPDATTDRPRLVQVLHLFDRPDPTDVAQLLIATRDIPEQVSVSGEEVVVDYLDTIHATTLTGPWIAKRLGGIDATARNWRTLTALVELAAD